MKMNKLQIRLIIGLIFVMAISILIFFFEPKINNEKNISNEKENSKIKEMNFIDLEKIY